MRSFKKFVLMAAASSLVIVSSVAMTPEAFADSTPTPASTTTQGISSHNPEAPAHARKAPKKAKKKTVKKKTVKKSSKKKTVKKSSKKTTKRVAAAPVGTACERGVARAARQVGMPRSTRIVCVSGLGKNWGFFQAGTSMSDGSWGDNVISIRNNMSEANSYHSAMHEIGHARFYTASRDKQARAMSAAGISDMDGGSYYRQYCERTAQAYAVFVGGQSWSGYAPISKAQYNAFFGALS